MNGAMLSVVVIGRNEGDRLTVCLDSVRAARQMPEPLEVIYVDSLSTDGSPARAASCGAKVIELGPGKLSAARARNAGWRAATAPFILFLDGDTILDPDFVRRALQEFADPKVAVVWVTGERSGRRPRSTIAFWIWTGMPGRRYGLLWGRLPDAPRCTGARKRIQCGLNRRRRARSVPADESHGAQNFAY